MRKIIYNPFFMLLAATICMATQCDKDIIRPSYNFSENINLFPERKVYHVGDTIWLQHLNPANTLFDVGSNRYFSTDTVAIQFTPVFDFYNSPSNISSEVCDFVTNGVNVGFSFKEWYGCNNVSFNFRLGIIFKKSGVYSIGFPITREVNPCSGVYMNGVGFPPSHISYRFMVADGNKDIYLSLEPAKRRYPKDYIENQIKNKQMFYFKVE